MVLSFTPRDLSANPRREYPGAEVDPFQKGEILMVRAVRGLDGLQRDGCVACEDVGDLVNVSSNLQALRIYALLEEYQV